LVRSLREALQAHAQGEMCCVNGAVHSV
jgi:hypothetical protein